MLVKSKYSPDHYVSLSSWARRKALTFWNGVPNRFVSPLDEEHGFGFVCGCGHSGTTLTAARLGNHSDVLLLGRETNAFDPQNGALGAKNIAAEWKYFAELKRNRLILEKTPKHVHSIGLIRRIVPSAKFILTIRNPLDNIASLYRRLGNLHASIGRWIVDNEAVLEQSQYSDVMLLRYEELTDNPAKQFRRLAEFLGLSWEDAILEAGGSAYGRIQQAGNMELRSREVQQPIEPRSGVWRDVLTWPEARLVAEKTAGLARAFGYQASISNRRGWPSCD